MRRFGKLAFHARASSGSRQSSRLTCTERAAARRPRWRARCAGDTTVRSASNFPNEPGRVFWSDDRGYRLAAVRRPCQRHVMPAHPGRPAVRGGGLARGTKVEHRGRRPERHAVRVEISRVRRVAAVQQPGGGRASCAVAPCALARCRTKPRRAPVRRAPRLCGRGEQGRGRFRQRNAGGRISSDRAGKGLPVLNGSLGPGERSLPLAQDMSPLGRSAYVSFIRGADPYLAGSDGDGLRRGG
jgi:hypothetical protein